MWRSSRNLSRWTGLCFVLVMSLGAGCAGPTKVNIPPLPGDLAFHDPNGLTVLRVEELSLARILSTYPPDGAYAIKLPDGTTGASYQRVIDRLPPSPADPAEAGASTYEVAQVQISGVSADVDVIRPTPDGDRQLVRVQLSVDMDGWYVRRVRPYNVDVVEQLRIIRGSQQPIHRRAPQTEIDAPDRERAALAADDGGL